MLASSESPPEKVMAWSTTCRYKENTRTAYGETLTAPAPHLDYVAAVKGGRSHLICTGAAFARPKGDENLQLSRVTE